MNRIGIVPLLASILLVHGPASALAQDSIRTERIQFKRGSTSAVVKGRIKGYETLDYLVGAREGQVMNASLATKNTSTYFNVLPPGSNDAAIFIGSTTGNQMEGPLPVTGDYRIRVYMMRNAARRNEVADYQLEVVISAAGAAAASTDAKVAGTNYNATGTVPCSMGSGKPTAQCNFGVERHGGGSAEVTVTRPDGRERIIIYQQGKPVTWNESQADQQPFKATRKGDMYIIEIGNERYDIPDAVVNGG